MVPRLEDLTLRLVHSEPPAIHQLQFRLSYTSIGSYRSYALVSCDSLSSPVSPIVGVRGLPCDLTSLTDLRRFVDFSVSSAFYLLGWSDDLQAPYTLDQKLEVSFYRQHFRDYLVESL